MEGPRAAPPFPPNTWQWLQRGLVRELDKPSTVDGVEEVVLGEMLDECVVCSAETIKEGQENNVSLRDGMDSMT